MRFVREGAFIENHAAEIHAAAETLTCLTTKAVSEPAKDLRLSLLGKTLPVPSRAYRTRVVQPPSSNT